MLTRLLFLCCLFAGLCLPALAQQDTSEATLNSQPQPRRHYYQDTNRNSTAAMMDSVARSLANREQYQADSVAMRFVQPDSNRANQFTRYIMQHELYKGYGFWDIKQKSAGIQREGTGRRQKERWIIFIVVGLLLYMGIINLVMNKEMDTILRSFYSRQGTQAGKEEGLINSQAFVALFLLFGLTSGLFIYQVSAAYDKYYSISGFQLFISLSVIIVVLFALKLLVLRFIGFVFKVNKMVSEYISILYLTYFNIAFVFLPLTLCFCLLPDHYARYLLLLAIVLIVVIFVWQYLRSSVNIISNFRFHKFYLFIYLCALEICPVLILIKALNI